MTMQTSIAEDWKELPFADCLQKVKLARGKQVQTKEYLESGEYPIIDQGQSVIAGFTNDEDKVISDIQPFIIFGDHTRVLKYVDFPIALGADGTKIIKPIDEFDSKFFFFFLKNLDISSQGYNRHFSVLKEKKILQPALPEQKAIARVLTTVQEAIAGQEELIAKLKELKRSMMNHLFTHGTKGEETKITEIGEMPESWEVVELGDVGEVSYGIQAAVASLTKPVGFKILTNKNITLDGEIVYDKVNYYEPKTKRELSSFVGNGDVLLNWRSGSKHHVGKTAIYTGDEKILHSSFILRIRTDQNKVINRFLYYYLNWLRETGYFVKLQTYSVNAKFNKSAVLSMDLAMPPINQQLLMLKAFDTISTKIEVTTAKLSDYQKLFNVLLHELMSGERRITNL